MLTPVDPRYLRREWEYVRAGLTRIIDRTCDDWIPEDVFAEIKAGVSRLFLLEYGGRRIGFVVLQVWPHYHDGPRIFVRALWCEPGQAKPHEADIYDDLRYFAAEHGASVMRMLSPRRWDGAGWELKQYVYEREV